ncbi:MAG: hypothetical protein U0Q19_01440 [Kineosporiaceae bacterium]
MSAASERGREPRPGSERSDDPVLPEQTRDDRDESGGDWREREREDDREDWLQNERPPHWE